MVAHGAHSPTSQLHPSLLQNKLVDELALLWLHFGQGFILDPISETYKQETICDQTRDSEALSLSLNILVRPALCWTCCGAQTHTLFTSQAASSFRLWEPEAAAVEPPVVLLPISIGFWLQLPEGQEDRMVMAVITCCSDDPARVPAVEYTWNNYHLLQNPALRLGFHRFVWGLPRPPQQPTKSSFKR